MKLIMDFVPNHTSNESEWFVASSDKNHADHQVYKDYYVWVDGNGTYRNETPNNWVNYSVKYTVTRLYGIRKLPLRCVNKYEAYHISQ